MRVIFHSCRLALKRTPFYLFYRGASSSCIDKTFSLPVGDNGSISLRVTRPKRSKAIAGTRPKLSSNVILYLPPGPLFKDSNTSIKNHGEFNLDELFSEPMHLNDSKKGHRMQDMLASATSATVVTVNYRLGSVGETTSDTNPSEELSNSADKDGHIKDPREKFYQYPNPVHDTLVGFDWIQSHLKPTQLGILGSNIGGSLALMLALTEAQSIQAVAVFDPVCDWTSLDEYCTMEESTDQQGAGVKHKRSTRKTAPADLVPLLEAREKFFASPEKWFDSFASPILFLRSAGKEIPKFSPQYLTGPGYPVPVLKNAGNQTVSESINALSEDDISELDEDHVDPERVVKRRKAISRWPPYGLDYGLSGQTWKGPNSGIGRLQVSLPWVRVFTQGQKNILDLDTEQSRHSAHTRHSNHNTTVLAHQGVEIISAMQRACFWGKEKGHGERRVTLSQRDGNSDQEVGTWFKSIFDNTIDND